MATEFLEAVGRANLAGSLFLILVLVLRTPARRLFGPEAAYGLWAAPVAAAVLSLAPWPFGKTWPGGELMTLKPLVTQAAAHLDAAVAVWLSGLLTGVAIFWRAQAAFEREARAGRAGPAVSGVLSPRVIMPAADPYTDDERVLIRAHEREHVRRGDPKANALAAALQVLFWFNPLVHLGARLMRIDQELACDAATLRRYPKGRRTYAEALLKTELARTPLPLGCMWPSSALHPLELRLSALKGRTRSDIIGPLATALFALSAGAAAWAGKPAMPAPPPHEWPESAGPTTSVMLITVPAGTFAEEAG